MPTSRQRRENAHRKLQRQLERRQAEARRRRNNWIVAGSVFAVVVVALGVWIVVTTTGGGDSTAAGASGSETAAAPTTAAAVGCTYTAATGGTGVKDVGKPADTEKPQKTGFQDLAVTMNGKPLTFRLDYSLAPCSVASWQFLVSKKFYDDTTCHRLTTSGLFVLQCGDPSGTGAGGPGYQYREETPPAADPTAQTYTYKRGDIAMANAGSGTTGSQFFIVYKDSPLPPNYSLVGQVTKGLDVVEAIASTGVEGGATDGKPAETVTIESVTPTK